MKTILRGYLLLAMILCFPPPAAHADVVERVAERGPATFVIGTSFLLMSLVTLPIRAVSGDDTALATCRLGHGVKMTTAGVALLPAGLLAAPFYPAKAATGFADSFAEAFQEDTCSRPVSAILP